MILKIEKNNIINKYKNNFLILGILRFDTYNIDNNSKFIFFFDKKDIKALYKEKNNYLKNISISNNNFLYENNNKNNNIIYTFDINPNIYLEYYGLYIKIKNKKCSFILKKEIINNFTNKRRKIKK